MSTAPVDAPDAPGHDAPGASLCVHSRLGVDPARPVALGARRNEDGDARAERRGTAVEREKHVPRSAVYYGLGRPLCGPSDDTTAVIPGLVLAEHAVAGRIACALAGRGFVTHAMPDAVLQAGGATMAAIVVCAPEVSVGLPGDASSLPRVVVGPADSELATAMLADGAAAYLLASLGPERLARAIFLLFAGSA